MGDTYYDPGFDTEYPADRVTVITEREDHVANTVVVDTGNGAWIAECFRGELMDGARLNDGEIDAVIDALRDADC